VYYRGQLEALGDGFTLTDSELMSLHVAKHWLNQSASARQIKSSAMKRRRISRET
jgi:hypothetical protein